MHDRLPHGVLLLLLTAACPSAAQTKAPASQPAAPAPAPASQPAAATAPTDPFLRLKVATPRDKLPPMRSIRVRDKREQQDRSREGTIRVSINSSPKGAAVLYGGKMLGNTPLTLTAKKGSTPFDVVLRARGYMTLRTRIRRKTSRGYFFKLTPAKIR